MTANGNEAVTLSQLKMFTESSNSGGASNIPVPWSPVWRPGMKW